MKRIFLHNLIILFTCVCLTLSADYTGSIEKGTLLLKQGKIQKSIEFFKSAIEENPSSSEAYYYLGYAYFLLGKKEESIKNYQKAIELNPKNPDYHYALASLFISLGDSENAIKQLDETIKADKVKQTQVNRIMRLCRNILFIFNLPFF